MITQFSVCTHLGLFREEAISSYTPQVWHLTPDLADLQKCFILWIKHFLNCLPELNWNYMFSWKFNYLPVKTGKYFYLRSEFYGISTIYKFEYGERVFFQQQQQKSQQNKPKLNIKSKIRVIVIYHRLLFCFRSVNFQFGPQVYNLFQLEVSKHEVNWLLNRSLPSC